MLNFFMGRRRKKGSGAGGECVNSSRLRIIVGQPKTAQELMLYGPRKTVICGQHELTEIQIDALLGVLLDSGFRPTLALMHTVAQLSPVAQLRCFPRSSSFAKWAFGQGIEAYLERQFERVAHA